MSPTQHNHDPDADCHFAAAGIAAVLNFPLWRGAAIHQSGFTIEGSNALVRYYKAVIQPPFRGVTATIFGMTWARGAIFYGSETGKEFLKHHGFNGPSSQAIPPLIIGTFVQIVNMPLVRATITLQDPNCAQKSTTEALAHIYRTRGVSGLWHGVSAGILKTVPKYTIAVIVKDYCEDVLPRAEVHDKKYQLYRSAIKSCAAGLAGAVLTNPLDVLRNEMFKTDQSLPAVFRSLMKEQGWAFGARGLTHNMTAVTIPVAITIFMTDILKSIKHGEF